MIEIATDWAEREGAKIEFIHGEACNMDFNFGVQVIGSYGCAAGNFQKRDIELDDFEILVLAI